MSSIEKKIGGKVTEARLNNKFTQAELAERVGVAVESISRLERGVHIPSLKTIERIAEGLNVKMKFFFDFDESEVKDSKVERELSKFIVFLRNLTEKEIWLIHKVSKAMIEAMEKSSNQ